MGKKGKKKPQSAQPAEPGTAPEAAGPSQRTSESQGDQPESSGKQGQQKRRGDGKGGKQESAAEQGGTPRQTPGQRGPGDQRGQPPPHQAPPSDQRGQQAPAKGEKGPQDQRGQHFQQAPAGGQRGPPDQRHQVPSQQAPQQAPAWSQRGPPGHQAQRPQTPAAFTLQQPAAQPQYAVPAELQAQASRGGPPQQPAYAGAPRGRGAGEPHPQPGGPPQQPAHVGAPKGRGAGEPHQQPGRGPAQAPPGGQPQRRAKGQGRGAQLPPGGPQVQQPFGGKPQRGPGGGEPRQQQPGASRPPSELPVSDVTSAVSRMQIQRRDFGDANIVSQSRRRPGVKGRRIPVESNHLALSLGQLNTAYHYDVAINPDTPKKFMRPVIESFRRKHFPTRYPAFDGKKNMYTSTPLTNNLNDVFTDQITIREEDGREKQFKVQIKFANSVDMTPLRQMLDLPTTPQEAIQVVDIVLRMAPVQTCFPVGRSFFVKPTNGIIELGEGMEMYHGFYQSAIRGWKPLLNVDVAHKAFPRNINVIDALVEVLTTGRQQFRREDLRTLDRYQEEAFLKYIKGLRVTYEIPGHPGSRKNYRVNGLGTSAGRATFESDGQKMTVLDYFARKKNYRLRYTDLPTLWVGNPQRPDKVLLPMELCEIMEGQALNRKMTEGQTSKMIRHAATNTAIRKNKIVQGIQRANYNQNPCVREFGFSVGNEFQKLDARVLQPPDLQYANRTARVSRGVWRNDAFLDAKTITKWTYVNACRYPPRPDDYRRMTDLFQRSARDCGMTFASPPVEPFANIGGRQTYPDVLHYIQSLKGKFDVVFVIIPDSGPQYSFVKKAAEIAVGVLTQCIKSVTVSRKMNQQTAVNILLKVNSKLNGINHTFTTATKPDILKRPVMIMGADVTHPGPDSRDIPSVAAVTASHDPKAFQYNICWRLQNPTVEIIEDLEAIVIEHLKFFFMKTKVKPQAIVFFRDGVSEGQFEQVKDAEIRAIRSACKKLQADGYEPKITFLVVQKRHHTRLFPLNERDSEDKNYNVPAGTCVDTDIVHPFLQDFYLVSHASIQGVAKPTKYCTLWDDNNMDNDQVEHLAYYLCHMFSRCNRSVSYPAPTYYAHLAAARAKVYIENDRLNMDRLRDEFAKYQIRDEIRHGLPMFFV